MLIYLEYQIKLNLLYTIKLNLLYTTNIKQETSTIDVQ